MVKKSFLKNDEILLENYFLYCFYQLLDINGNIYFYEENIMYHNLKITDIIENKYHSIILNIEYKQFPEWKKLISF